MGDLVIFESSHEQPLVCPFTANQQWGASQFSIARFQQVMTALCSATALACVPGTGTGGHCTRVYEINGWVGGFVYQVPEVIVHVYIY
jgi:hypothetical protein